MLAFVKGLKSLEQVLQLGDLDGGWIQLVHPEKDEFLFEIETRGFVLGLALAIFHYFINDGDVDFPEPPELLSDGEVDFANSPPEDAVELVFDCVFGSGSGEGYLPLSCLAMSAQWLPSWDCS